MPDPVDLHIDDAKRVILTVEHAPLGRPRGPSASSSAEQLQRLLALLRRARRHAGKAALVILLGAGVSLSVALLEPRRWESEAVVLYRKMIYSLTIDKDAPRPTAREAGKRLQELTLARPSLRRIIAELGLYKKLVRQHGWVRATDELKRHARFRIGGGDTFHIAFEGPTPQLARDVVRRLAAHLVATNTKLRTQNAERLGAFMKEQMHRVAAQLVSKERELARFLARHPDFAPARGDNVGGLIVAKRKRGTRSDHARRALQRHLARLQAQLAAARSRKPRVIRDPALVEAQQIATRRLAEARAALRRELARKTDDHPDVAPARALVREARARLARTSAAARASERTIKPSSRRQRELERRIAALRASLRHRASGAPRADDATTKALVDLETRWSTLHRAVKELRTRYLALETDYFRSLLRLQAARSGKAQQMQIVDPAYLPHRPSGMGRVTKVALGVTASMVFAGLFVVLLGLTDRRIYDRFDVEQLGMDVLVACPRASRRQRREARRRASAKAAEPRSRARS